MKKFKITAWNEEGKCIFLNPCFFALSMEHLFGGYLMGFEERMGYEDASLYVAKIEIEEVKKNG